MRSRAGLGDRGHAGPRGGRETYGRRQPFSKLIRTAISGDQGARLRRQPFRGDRVNSSDPSGCGASVRAVLQDQARRQAYATSPSLKPTSAVHQVPLKHWVPRRPEASDGAEMPRVAFPRLRRGDGERPRTEQGQTTFETGSRKPAGLQAASLRARAIWTRSARLQTGRQQPSMRRINRPDTRKSLTQRPELDKENACVAGAGRVRKERPRKKALPIPNND